MNKGRISALYQSSLSCSEQTGCIEIQGFCQAERRLHICKLKTCQPCGDCCRQKYTHSKMQSLKYIISDMKNTALLLDEKLVWHRSWSLIRGRQRGHQSQSTDWGNLGGCDSHNPWLWLLKWTMHSKYRAKTSTGPKQSGFDRWARECTTLWATNWHTHKGKKKPIQKHPDLTQVCSLWTYYIFILKLGPWE